MDRTYKILLILSLILGVIQPVQAQHILKGIVYDEAGTGVFSTTLRVLTEDSVFAMGDRLGGAGGDFVDDRNRERDAGFIVEPHQEVAFDCAPQ